MKKIILIFILFLFLQNTFSQIQYSLPEGFVACIGEDGNESKVEADFDTDGINDLAILCCDDNDQKIIVVYLASKWLIDKNYWWFPWNFNTNLISFNNKVLIIDSNDDYNFIKLKLKYYTSLKNMKLIGYDRSYYMRHPTTFIGSNSINLITGEYSINNGPNKKIKINTITLDDIEKYFEYLSKVGGVFND